MSEEVKITCSDHKASWLLQHTLKKDGWKITGAASAPNFREIWAIPPHSPIEFTPTPITVNLPDFTNPAAQK